MTRKVIKRSSVILLVFLMVLSFVGCKSDKGNEMVDTDTSVEGIEEVEEVMEGLALNPLTGLYIDEEVAKRRPVAVMINNIKKALPQSGISQADVIYETLAEGNITRLLAIFQDFDANKIGPVRSARHYYLDLAFNHDAVYLHYGGSPHAFQAIKDLKVDNLNGLSSLDKIMCWRDSERMKQKGMYEHSVYTNAEKIMKAWDVTKHRQEIKEGIKDNFVFSKEELKFEGQKADKVSLPFTNQITTGFQYDEETGLYKRTQYNGAHIDEMNNQQLTTKNIIIQYVEIFHIAGDTAGRRDMKLVGSGNGMYITNGNAMPITWSKETHQSPTIYKDEGGNTLTMNKGNTWIIIFPNNRQIELD